MHFFDKRKEQNACYMQFLKILFYITLIYLITTDYSTNLGKPLAIPKAFHTNNFHLRNATKQRSLNGSWFMCVLFSGDTLCAESVCSLLCSWQNIADITDAHLKDYLVTSDGKGIKCIFYLSCLGLFRQESGFGLSSGGGNVTLGSWFCEKRNQEGGFVKRETYILSPELDISKKKGEKRELS